MLGIMSHLPPLEDRLRADDRQFQVMSRLITGLAVLIVLTSLAIPFALSQRMAEDAGTGWILGLGMLILGPPAILLLLLAWFFNKPARAWLRIADELLKQPAASLILVRSRRGVFLHETERPGGAKIAGPLYLHGNRWKLRGLSSKGTPVMVHRSPDWPDMVVVEWGARALVFFAHPLKALRSPRA